MGKLIYSMLMSLDGYVEDEHGCFDFAVPDEEVHSYINQLKADASHDIIVNGPELIAHALSAGMSTSFNVCLPSGRRQRKTVLPGWCAAEARVGQRAPVPPWRGRSAMRRSWLIDRKLVGDANGAESGVSGVRSCCQSMMANNKEARWRTY
jgi:hypothetical protein